MLAPDPDRLRVLVAPGHAPDMRAPVVKALRGCKADLVFTSEFYRLASDPLAGYTTVVGHSATNTRAVNSPHGDAGDNPVLVAEALPITRRHMERVDDPAPHSAQGGKFAPERWNYSVDVDWAHGVTAISTHPSPLFVGRAKWEHVMRRARHEVEQAQKMGHGVILAGDLQTGGRLVRHALAGLGLSYWTVGVVWLAWSGLHEVKAAREILQPTGMDHEWMRTEFKAVR